MSAVQEEVAVPADAGMWKAWTLICVNEATRMGVEPLTQSQLHVILYLANTLADLFDVTRIRGRVLKRGSYPFYPDVQRDIDRLAFCGVLSIEQVDFGPRGHLAAHYGLGPAGSSVCASILAHSEEARRTAHLFSELVSACFGRFLSANAAIGPIDANYGSNAIVENEVVDFSEWEEDNRNLEVARYLITRLRALRPRAERDGVRLYCDYLDNALAAGVQTP